MSEIGQVYQTLIEVMRHENPQFRCLAAQALGASGAHTPVKALLASLWDEDPDVSYDVVVALGALGHPTAEEALVQYYQEVPYAEFKVAALEAVAKIGGQEAEALLLSVARKKDPSWEAVEEEDWDSYWDAQLKAVEGLGNLGVQSAVPVIEEILATDPELTLLETAIKALSKMGAPGSTALETLARLGDIGLKRRLAVMLPDLPESALPLAKILLDSGDIQTRADTLEALSRLGLPVEDALLRDALDDQSQEVRRAAVFHLKTRAPSGWEAVWRLRLEDSAPIVREAAFLNLGKADIPERQELLGLGMRDSIQAVRVAAIQSIALPADESLLKLLQNHLLHPAATPMERIAIMEALGRLGSPASREGLFGALEDPDGGVRAEAFGLLTHWGGEVQEGFVLEALRGTLFGEPSSELFDSPPVPVEDLMPDSAEEEEPALQNIPEGESFPTSTLDALTTPSDGDAEDALDEEISELTEKETEMVALVDARTKENEVLISQSKIAPRADVRILATQRAGELHLAEALPDLINHLNSGEEALRIETMKTLGQLGLPDAIPALRNVLATEEASELRIPAIKALGDLGGAETLSLLETLWPGNTEGEADAILEALTACGATADHPALHEALASNNPNMVKKAVFASLPHAKEQGSLQLLIQTMGNLPDYNWQGMGEKILALGEAEAFSAVLAVLGKGEKENAHFVFLPLLADMFRNRG